MDTKITAVIIDTSVYYKNQCDFVSLNKSIIPLFLKLIQRNNITLLTHPILEHEIRKHIMDSSILTSVQELLNRAKKCKNQLELIGVSSEELVRKVQALKLDNQLKEAFSEYYKEAIALPYVSADVVFEDYFKNLPPFSPTGKKKSEFPDAFIIKGLVEYCNNTPDMHVLAIADDSDWKQALDKKQQIKQVDTLEEAMIELWSQLDDKSELFEVLINRIKDEIKVGISSAAEYEAYSIETILDAEDVEISNISVVDFDENIVPLEVNDDSVLLQIQAILSVDGMSDYLDENRSMWDKEDQCYYFMAYTHLEFKKAEAIAECEIRIKFPKDGSFSPVELESVKITNKYDISISLEHADTSEEDITDYGEDDYLAEQADAAEEYYKH